MTSVTYQAMEAVDDVAVKQSVEDLGEYLSSRLSRGLKLKGASAV